MITKQINTRLQTIDDLIEALEYINENSNEYSDDLGWVFETDNSEIKYILEASARLLSDTNDNADQMMIEKLRDAGYTVLPAGKMMDQVGNIEMRKVGTIQKRKRGSLPLLYTMDDKNILI